MKEIQQNRKDGTIVLVAGSRRNKDANVLIEAMRQLEMRTNQKPVMLCHGGAAGTDWHADAWAKKNGIPNPIIIKPDYEKYHPKAAPLERNTLLVQMADVVVCVYAKNEWGKGGTADTARKAKAAGLPVLETDGKRTTWIRANPQIVMAI